MPTSGRSSTLTEQIPLMRLKASNIGPRCYRLIGALLVCLTQSLAWSSSAQDVRGTVTDRSGAVISRAQVVLHIAGQNFGRVTQADGSFVFSGVAADAGTVEVSSPGFATTTIDWHAGDKPLAVVLTPATV